MSIQHFQTKQHHRRARPNETIDSGHTLRLALEYDLAMLYEWLTDLLSLSGGREKKHACTLLTYRNSTCQAF